MNQDRNPERNQRVIAMVNDGATYGQVAARPGISRETVAGIMWRCKRRQKRECQEMRRARYGV